MNKEEIMQIVKDEVGAMLGIDSADLDVNRTFDRYGVDSAVGIGIIGNLSDAFELDLDPTEIYDNPTIAALSDHIHSLKLRKEERTA